MKKNIFIQVATIATVLLCSAACTKKLQNSNTTPVITSITPSFARGGDTITVHGRNFSSDISNISVSINRKIATIISVAPDSIHAVVPQHAGSGKVEVNVNSTAYEGPDFTYEYKVIVTTIAGTGNVGTADGPGQSASFYCPWGITADANGDLFVADCYNRLIRKISAVDNSVSSFQIGTTDFYSPYNIAVDTTTHNLFVTDFNTHLMRVDPSGNLSVIYTAEMPMAGIAVSPDSKSLFISNNTLGTITKTDINGGNPTLFTSGLVTPRNIIFDNKGNMFVAAAPASVYQISTNDGTFTAAVNYPDFQGWEVAKDTSGNFYLADHFNNRLLMVDKTGAIKTIAGNSIAADIDGVGLEASFNGPQGITIDSKGNLYVTTFNYNDNTGNKVRKVSFQ